MGADPSRDCPYDAQGGRRRVEPRTAHDGQMPIGRALYLGREETREPGFYSETRLKQSAEFHEEDMTRTLLARAFRMLAAANVTFSWREMANFISQRRLRREGCRAMPPSHRKRVLSRLNIDHDLTPSENRTVKPR